MATAPASAQALARPRRRQLQRGRDPSHRWRSEGFYGDGVEPTTDVLDAGVDYLVCEALAELTLAILQKDRRAQRGPRLHPDDLPGYVRSALPFLVDGRTRS